MTKFQKTICFIADGHDLYDDRMYWKEALSLKRNGYHVYIIVVSDIDKKGTTLEGVEYILIKRKCYPSNSVLKYISKIFKDQDNQMIVQFAEKIKADVYHFHDFKQHRIVKKLKKLPHKPKIIFDAREPLDLNFIDFFKGNKIKKWVNYLYAKAIQKFEYRQIAKYDLVLTVDHGLFKRFEKNAKVKRLINLYNYTNLQDKRLYIPFEQRQYDVIYCGGISELRGFYTLLNVAKELAKQHKKVLLLGSIIDQNLENYFFNFVKINQLEQNLIWKKHVRFDEVSVYYNQSKIGLNLLMPVSAFQHIMQIKLFEYMNFGLPIVCSDFGEMQNIVLENKAGVCVHPTDVHKAVATVLQLLENPDLYKELSENGIKAVDQKFNWQQMEKILLRVYNDLVC